MEAEDVFSMVCTTVDMFICPPEHHTPGMCLPVRFMSRPSTAARTQPEGAFSYWHGTAVIGWTELSDFHT